MVSTSWSLPPAKAGNAEMPEELGREQQGRGGNAAKVWRKGRSMEKYQLLVPLLSGPGTRVTDLPPKDISTT